MRLFSFILFISFSLSQILDRYHPELKWLTFKTEHFDITFHEGTKQSAIRIAEIAESIYGPITKSFKHEPAKRITWVIRDTDDYSNGAAYFLDHKIEIWTENLDYDLRGTHNWLRNVVTHEFIHMIHIQKSFPSSLNIPLALVQWMEYERERRRDVVRGFPNVLINYPILLFNIPAWLAEGVAQNQVDAARYDYRDPQREMILRDRFLYNQVLSLDEMAILGKSSIGNESTYNQGFSLVEYITTKYGEESLAQISEINAEWVSLYDYQSVFRQAIGKGLDELYQEWFLEKQSTFAQAVSNLKPSLKSGNKIWSKGEGNFYPKYSPDGKWLAFVSSANSQSMANNALFVMNRESGVADKKIALISSQINWFPDGSAILYSKKSEANKWGSHYNDLYKFDIKTGEETRLTFGLRARNATINSDNQIVFVTTHDGTANLMGFKLGNNRTFYQIDFSAHQITTDESELFILGSNLEFITTDNDFTQYYHPVFKNKNTIYVDYSKGYQRSIAEVNIDTKQQAVLITGNSDFRNPTVSNGRLYFASDKTGIFNIYKMEESGQKALTNVTGGAFMPDFVNGNLVYSQYDSLAFHISELKELTVLDENKLAYENKSYLRNEVPKPETTTYSINKDSLNFGRQRSTFKSYYFIPRIFVDDKRPKFGGIFLVNELLDRIQLFVGAAANFKGERDVFSIIEYRNLNFFGSDPILFFEGYNQTTRISDRFEVKYDLNNQYFRADRDVEFVLWQFEFGWKMKLWNSLDWRFAYVISKYQAELSPIVTNSVFSNGSQVIFEFPFLRYDYHKGQAFENRFLFEIKDPSFTGEIVPRTGMRIFSNITFNQNEFLDGFGFNTTGVEEQFTSYDYWYMKADFRYHFPALTKTAGLSIRLAAEGNLEETDDFYDIYAGGWIGLKGYPYFAIHGRQSILASITYNQLLFKDIGWTFAKLHFKNMAISTFFEVGDAWRGDNLDLKRDIGFQLKLETYEQLKIYFEGAYPLDQVSITTKSPDLKDINITYKPEWRYYFGVNYDFELMDIL